MTPSDNRADLLAPSVMSGPVVWLASDAANGFSGNRLVAEVLDEALPLDERVARASAPVGWSQLGRQPAS
jgi:hypothetical protein